MFLTFELHQERFRGVACLLERKALPPVGGVEGGFFTDSYKFKNYKTTDFLSCLSDVIDNPKIDWVLVSRNSSVIVDENLLDRLERLLAHTASFQDRVTLFSGGGLGAHGEKHCALYSSREPFIFFSPDLRPIVDTMIDLYLVSAESARHFIRENGTAPAEIFELALIVEGYARENKVSLYSPDLAAGINGDFQNRNLAVMANQIEDLSSVLTSDGSLDTFAGPLAINRKPDVDAIGRSIPSSLRSMEQLLEKAIDPLLDSPTLSIVTRTQFHRLYLLRRLLTSIARARIDTLPIEVMLSTDIAEDIANKHLEMLRDEFPNLEINLSVNRRAEHSRVANLLGGADRASGDYIWFMDDDDYIDLFAFQSIRHAFFCNARPFILGDSALHKERWNLSNPSFPVLAHSSHHTDYPGNNWRYMFGGVNHLPICGPVIPREFLVDRIKQFDFKFDLSEDYTLFLLLLSSPDIPNIVNLSKVIAHISIREDGDNSVTAPDRTGWTRDISNYLYSLLYGSPPRNGNGWAALLNQSAPQLSADVTTQLRNFQSNMKRKESHIRQLKSENDHLREVIASLARGNSLEKLDVHP